MSLPRAGLALSPLLLGGNDTTGWRFRYAAPGTARHRALSPSRCSRRPEGPSREPVSPRCPPVPAGRGAGAGCHRGSPSTGPGTGWHRSPWDKAAATRCPGEPPQPAERSRDESLSGACTGGAGGAGRGSSIQLCVPRRALLGQSWRHWESHWFHKRLDIPAVLHRAQVQRGGDTVWVQGHPQACFGASPQARTVPQNQRGVLTS